MKLIKSDIGMIICAIIITAGTIYLVIKLEPVERLVWGIWGMALLIGTELSCNQLNKSKN